MQNGVCREYYTTQSVGQNQNSITEQPKQKIITINNPKMDCKNSYGFHYIMDPYYVTRNKFFVYEVKPNTPAQKSGLKVGDEILKIDENKVNKMNINMFENALSPKSITIEFKNNTGKKIITMTQTIICTPIKENDDLFNTYWKQIYTGRDLEDITLDIQATSKIYNHLSYGLKQYLQELSNQLSYWQPKKIKFQSGYNSCKAHYMIDSEMHSCISNLVNREIAQMQHEEYIRQQQAILQTQQQMQQQQVNALNNYSDALRNQHVNVSGSVNVQHSGTVNVNQNVYGTMYHYNRW